MLHMGPALTALHHVTTTWNEVQRDRNMEIARLVDDPVHAGMLLGATELRRRLVTLCGGDLTVQQNINPFFHTGPNDATKGDYRTKRPHEWVEAVMDGRSGGKGAPVKDGAALGGARARAPHEKARKMKTWQQVVRHFIAESMFRI